MGQNFAGVVTLLTFCVPPLGFVVAAAGLGMGTLGLQSRSRGLAVSGIALGRVVCGWQARRAAIYSSVSFAAVVVLYVAFRFAESNGGGRFL